MKRPRPFGPGSVTGSWLATPARRLTAYEAGDMARRAAAARADARMQRRVLDTVRLVAPAWNPRWDATMRTDPGPARPQIERVRR